ncbi:hypothetical protein AVEN_115892-1 [Araneus ventricosus]|uniref:RNA-directed DNA polymerase n=1 Tax=Araneus ventricosus TaxID=182803 RepID=A0A4Y2KUD7_ARAVE|nr:hypothetical protein AVEN_115892-1 [Araneus ventricosus]
MLSLMSSKSEQRLKLLQFLWICRELEEDPAVESQSSSEHCSKLRSTLGSTDKVIPEFKLYHDYALQTKPYPIPKIANEYAQEEIKKIIGCGEFSILTDAKPLSHHFHLDKQPDIVARWLLYLQSFSYSIEHIPGFSNPADFLTRVQEETHVNNLKIFSIPNGMNYDNIKSHQQNDKETKEIIDKINDNNNVTCKDYYMDNNSGLLMIKIKPRIKHLRNKHIENKIVIPKSLVKTCLETAHGLHFGTTRTFHVVEKNYYWKNYFLDTKNFCENCHECIKNKSKPTNTQFEMISKSHLAPGQFIAIDIVGKLPRSYDGTFFILTITDHYSRFLDAIPLPNITSSTIIKALNQYFARFGIPKIILTDNGTNLRSNEID